MSTKEKSIQNADGTVQPATNDGAGGNASKVATKPNSVEKSTSKVPKGNGKTKTVSSGKKAKGKRVTGAHVVAFVLSELLVVDKMGVTEIVNGLGISRGRCMSILTAMVKARLLRRAMILNDKKVLEYAFAQGAHPIFKMNA